jgi:RNA polymerase sigma-70 factor, ECF subfamily
MTDDLNELRPRMMSVAYRMLGSVADAEDAVQDAFLRYQTAGGVASVEGLLVTVNPDKLARWSVAEVD